MFSFCFFIEISVKMFSTFSIHGSNINFVPSSQIRNYANIRFKQPNTFAQLVQIQRKRTFLIEQKLKENMPICYFLIHTVVLINVSLALIVLQFFGIKYAIPYYNIASGLW